MDSHNGSSAPLASTSEGTKDPNASTLESHEAEDIDRAEEGDEDFDEEDLPKPIEGSILEPGDYFLELEVNARRETVAEALRRSGFVEIIPDQHPRVIKTTEAQRTRRHHFIGRLVKKLRVRNLADSSGQWLYAKLLHVNVFSDLRLKTIAFLLKAGKIYETRFISRMRTNPTRDMVERDLHELGFKVLHLSALQRDMRLPSRENSSVTLWFGVLLWDAQDSVITGKEDFYFEDMLHAAGEESVLNANAEPPILEQ
jgi:hypothetical protein